MLVMAEVPGLTLALPAAAIAELVHEPALVRPPLASAALAGLFCLRGQVVPVLRPDVLFALPPPPPGPFRVLVVFRAGIGVPGVWALLVERALGVLAPRQLAPVPPGHSLGGCVVALVPGCDVPVLAPERLLTQSEAAVMADLAERARARWKEFAGADG